MGQLNLPIINRTGYTMHWNSVWDNYYNYRKEFNKNLFLKNILILLLNDRLVYKSFFLSKKFKILFESKNLDFSIFTVNDFSEFAEISRKSIPCFFSRVWYLKYQNWILISLFIYSTKIQRQKAIKKHNLRKPNKHFSYYNYLYFLKNDFIHQHLTLNTITAEFY